MDCRTVHARCIEVVRTVHQKEGEEELLPSSGGQDDRSDEIAKKKSNSLLAAIFGFTYLVCEALMKVASTYIPTKFSGGENTIYVVFTILSVLCAFGMLFIVDLSEIAGTTKKRDENTSLREMLTVKTTEAIRLLFTDPKMILLYPVQMAFELRVRSLRTFTFTLLFSPHRSRYTHTTKHDQQILRKRCSRESLCQR